MGTVRKPGEKFLSRMKKMKQKEQALPGEHEGTNDIAEHNDALQCSVSVQGGRTVSLKQFEFARITVAMRTGVKDPEKRDEAYDQCLGVVNEILNRECSKIAGDKRDDEAIAWTVEGGQRTVTIEYGLTVSLARYESAKVDIGITQPISDDADIEKEIEALQKWTEEKIAKEDSKIRNSAELSMPTGDYGV